jgi:tRNA(fMet)-specific endonuclease VapC
VSRYLLDTTPLAAYLFGRPQAVARIGPWVVQRDAATSVLVYAEIIEHVQGRADFPRHRLALRRLLREVRPFVLTYATLERYAALRRTLRPVGNLIGDMDTLIAATAMERGLTLVTSDSHFQRVPGLSVLIVDRQQFRQ